MSKLNLSEAAAEILKKSVGGAPKAQFGDGYKPNVKAPQQAELEIGTAGHKTTDNNYDATKGVPTATPPGATPPVGSEKWGDNPSKGADAAEYNSEPQNKAGRKDLAGSPEGGETSETDKVNRKAGPKPKQTMPSNKGAVTCAEGEDEEEFENEEEEFEEATLEEVEYDLENLTNEAFEEKYGMDKEEAMRIVSEASEEDEEDEGEACKKAEKKEAMKMKMKEDVDAMLSGENLSEEFKQKASMIFEAAVEARVEEIASELEEKYTQEFEETLEVVKEDFANKLDSYLDYVVENWMEANKLAIEKGLRTEIVEDFIGALRNVFVEHYIDIPEDKVDVVEGLVDRVEDLENQVNEQIMKNIDLKKSIAEHKKVEAITAVCEGLTLSQAEKVKSLAKSIEFVSEEDFAEKLETIKESYFPNDIKPATTESLNDAVEIDEDYTTKVVDPLIEAYANKITKLTKF